MAKPGLSRTGNDDDPRMPARPERARWRRTPGFAQALRLTAAAILALQLPFHAPARAAEPCVDVALVLSLDASASVSAAEFALQQQGIAAAFREPEVQDAIAMAGRVAVSAMFWGSEGLPKQQTDWTIVESPADAERFARGLQTLSRQVTGDTGLGSGLKAALEKFETFEGCAVRKVINLSGDGEDTMFFRRPRHSPVPIQVRKMAEARNVEINALAIANEEKELADYYERNVITGPDAFVMNVADYSAFAEALQKKLIREIGPRSVADGLPDGRGTGGAHVSEISPRGQSHPPL
jgi:hypothetical protein